MKAFKVLLLLAFSISISTLLYADTNDFFGVKVFTHNGTYEFPWLWLGTAGAGAAIVGINILSKIALMFLKKPEPESWMEKIVAILKITALSTPGRHTEVEQPTENGLPLLSNPKTNFGPGGATLVIAALIIGGLCSMVTPSFAADPATNAAPPLFVVGSTTIGDATLGYIGILVNYIKQNGEVGAGLGGTLSDLERGRVSTVVFQEIDPFDTGTNHAVQVKLGLAHTECFASDKLHDGLGVGGSIALLHIPQLAWIKVPVKLADVRLGLRITEDTDQLIRFKFAARTTAFALTAGFNF